MVQNCPVSHTIHEDLKTPFNRLGEPLQTIPPFQDEEGLSAADLFDHLQDPAGHPGESGSGDIHPPQRIEPMSVVPRRY